MRWSIQTIFSYAVFFEFEGMIDLKCVKYRDDWEKGYTYQPN